jgi:hypothetical protein
MSDAVKVLVINADEYPLLFSFETLTVVDNFQWRIKAKEASFIFCVFCYF